MTYAKMVLGCLIGIFALGAAPLFAAQENLMDKSLEDLLNMPVTSASGREQKKTEVASAMTVITKEDIQRSGAHNIPDLFYSVPGMQVRKIDSRRYFVGIRGPGSFYQGNILVLLDDVVVFNPLKNGTNWELLPVTLNEIERIEIIRGPGGVLYSSNAVNGVINIITKKATEHDNYVAARAGSMLFTQEQVGMGEKVNDKLSIRVYADHNRDSGFVYKKSDVKVPNASESETAGLKIQYNWSPDTRLVVDGKYLDEGSTNDGPGGPSLKKPGYMRAFDARFEQKVNEVYDYNLHIDHMGAATTVTTSEDAVVDAFTFKTQHNLKYSAWGEHITSAGLEARWIKINDEPDFQPPADPRQTQKVDSVFLQDEYRPTDKLILTPGVRVTDNTIVPAKEGLLVEPRAAVVYVLNDRHNLRAMVTKSNRTPSVFDKDLHFFYPPAGMNVRGDETMEAEKAITYEVGWQGVMLEDKLRMDTSIFYSKLKDAFFLGGTPNSVPELPIVTNGGFNTMGLEWDADYKLTDALSLKADYTYTNADPRPEFDPTLGEAGNVSHFLSKHQLGSGFGYAKDGWTADVYAKWISKYIDTVRGSGKHPSFYKTTLRVAHAFRLPAMKMKNRDAEIELVANDVFGARTIEPTNEYIRQPDVYVGLKIKF